MSKLPDWAACRDRAVRDDKSAFYEKMIDAAIKAHRAEQTERQDERLSGRSATAVKAGKGTSSGTPGMAEPGAP